jgi:hypothetical protein
MGSIEDVSCVLFEPFAKLPIELRLQIWAHAATFPQIIRLRDPGGSRALEGDRCPLALVSKEAREEVLRVKQNYYAGRRLGPRLYANLDVDTLWLEECSHPFVAWTRSMIWLTGSKLRLGSKDGIRRLAFSYKFWHLVRNKYGLGPPWIMTLNLEEVILVVDPDEVPQGETAISIEPRTSTHLLESTEVFDSWKSTPWAGRPHGTWEEMAQFEMNYLGNLKALYQKNSEDPLGIVKPFQLMF